MTNPALVMSTPVADEIVSIISVDPHNFRATAATRYQSFIQIDLHYHVGAIHVIPAPGDQWLVRRHAQNWVLVNQMPTNTTELLSVVDNPVPGLTQVGSTNPSSPAPLHLNGSVIEAKGPLVLSPPKEGAPIPPAGALVYNPDTGKPGISDGAGITPIGGGGDITEIEGLEEALDAKADAEHTHPIDDITDLATTLDGKADAGHSHGDTALDPDLEDIAALTPADKDIIQRVGDHWINVSPDVLKSDLNMSFTDLLGQCSLSQIFGLTEMPLNALNLFNLIPTDLMAQIPFSNIGSAITNLVADPDFMDPGSFTGLEEWFHLLGGGFGGTGAATATADGTTKNLLSNLIPVSAGQIMPISVKAKWTDLVGTGNPIALAVTGYLPGGATDQQIIASHNTTPPTTDWIDLYGDYEVPDNVTGIRTRLVVDSTATAGDVAFSKVRVTKTQSIFQNLIAGTDTGTFLPNDIENLFIGTITNALELLNKTPLSDHNSLLSALGGEPTDIENRMNSFLDMFSPLNANNINEGAISDQHVPGLGTIHDAVVTTVGNLGGSGFDIGKLMEVLSGQTHSVVDAASGVVQMFARVGHLESKMSALPVAYGGTGSGAAQGGAIGVIDTDNMERVSSTSLGPTWLTTYKGGAGIWATPNGHDATFASSGTQDRDFLCIRNNSAIPRSATDYQRVTLELSSKSERYYDPLFGAFNYTGHDDIWLRISDDTVDLNNVTGIRIRYGGDGTLSIVRFVTGNPTVLESRNVGFIVPPGPGAVLIGESGVLADGALRTFRAKIGASIRLAHTEIGTASGVGAAFRRWGHGGRAEGHLLGQERPGGAHFWNAMDQTL